MKVVAYVSLYSLVGWVALALAASVAVIAGLMQWPVVLIVAVGMAAVGAYWAGILGGSRRIPWH